MKTIATAFVSLAITQILTHAAVVTVDLGSGSYNLRDNGGTPLTAGTAANGDGALIFLGFYSDATLANPFGSSDANFIKLSGVGNTFGTANTTIGDYAANFAAAGEFFINGLLINDTVNPGGLPAPMTPLVVRVLDSQVEGNATYKMEFANTNLWKWVSPTVPSPSINIDLDDANLRLMNPTGRTSTAISGGGNINADVQVNPVPEPSAFAFGLLTVASVLVPRLRRRD